jgi:hypothetical protein
MRGLGYAKAVDAITANAQRRAKDVLSVIENIKAGGAASSRQIAKALNERGMLAPRGGHWHPTSVQRVISRTTL